MTSTKRRLWDIGHELRTHMGTRDFFHPERVYWWNSPWDVPPFGWLFIWYVTALVWLGERLGWLAGLDKEGKHDAT